MRAHELPTSALEPTLAVIRRIRPDQLDAATPCADFTVAALLDHMREWAPILSAASPAPGTSTSEATSSAPERGASTGTFPPSALEADLIRLAAAWSSPSAWEGTATMGGGPAMPAATIGGMALGEIVIHGWDLARATGQDPRWNDDVLSFLHGEVARTAALGRQVKAYGSEVPVPPAASPLARMLGLTGRNPQWEP